MNLVFTFSGMDAQVAAAVDDKRDGMDVAPHAILVGKLIGATYKFWRDGHAFEICS
jgi:hypothetical protein